MSVMAMSPHALTPSALTLAARTVEPLRRDKMLFWPLFGNNLASARIVTRFARNYLVRTRDLDRKVSLRIFGDKEGVEGKDV